MITPPSYTHRARHPPSLRAQRGNPWTATACGLAVTKVLRHCERSRSPSLRAQRGHPGPWLRSPHSPIPTNQESLSTLISQLRGLIEAARGQALRAVDSIQVRTCWEIGRHIVEFEQQGADRAMYGSRLVPKLAESLTAEFGKGFDERNLRHMRTFFQDFPIWNAVRTELSWTHYRNLLRVDGEQARHWYMNEAADQNWSTRALDGQIGTLYYERLLASRDRDPVRQEAAVQIAALQKTPREFVRDPVLLEFLGLQPHSRHHPLRRQRYLCSALFRPARNEQLFASKYKLVLPSEDELRAELEKEQLWLAEQGKAAK